jgi:hypothetical protein
VVGDARSGNLDVGGLKLDADKAPALQHRRHAGRPRADGRVEHEAAGRAEQPHQPAHQRKRLDGWVGVAGLRRFLSALSVGEEVERAAR